MLVKKLKAHPGLVHPLGATVKWNGVNFSIFSRNATSIELLLFENHNSKEPFATYQLDPLKNNTFHFWHIFIENLHSGVFYAYRIDGPKTGGHKFNPKKVLLDPYAKSVSISLWDRSKACDDSDNLKYSLRGVVIDVDTYNWEGDKSIVLPTEDLIIYEAHVKGFTASKTAKVKYPGTFKGLTEKVPYLKSLGINALELLPVFQFDSNERVGSGDLGNYWGYSTMAYFAPNNEYCTTTLSRSHVREFRDMVKALHKAGIAVILDVVFNHTGEGDERGPMISFKGIDNNIYYLTSPQNRNAYMNYSGCGNTMNCNHPIVSKFILDCLEYWREEMHVDGFRFDEGSIMSRDEFGQPMTYPPVIWNIELSDKLAEAKVVTEAWDAAGLYQIGNFPGYRYMEFNGQFRDDVRHFIRGDGLISLLAQRLAGSADIYQSVGHLPTNSLNFITCHDGFTMFDSLSYADKHNEANGLNNSDGINNNVSTNFGVEGVTEDGLIRDLRDKQMRNFFCILMLSRGVPFICMGDEIKRTKNGNNNTFCQDNELSWMDWDLVIKNSEMLNFVRAIIAFRKEQPVLRQGQFYTGQVNDSGFPDITFHGCALNSPGWDNPKCKVLALTLSSGIKDALLHIMINMEDKELSFQIPIVKDKKWRKRIDTDKTINAILFGRKAPLVLENEIMVKARSIVVLVAK